MNHLKEYNGTDTILASIDHDGDEYMWVVNEAKREIAFSTRSAKDIRDFKAFMKQHSFMNGAAVSIGLDALDTYRSNKRLTTRFIATTHIERQLYRKMSADLVKSGQYTILKNGRKVKDGWLWELKRKTI
jgi:regulatory protein YycH of two-component signal transduction system YycFG